MAHDSDNGTNPEGPDTTDPTDQGSDRPEPQANTEIDSRQDTGPVPERDPQRDRDPRDEPTQIANEERRRNMAFVAGIVAILGVWTALSVVLFGGAEAAFMNNVLVGSVVFLAAGYNSYRQYNDTPLSIGIASLVVLLGIWLIVGAAVLEMVGWVFWNTVVSGLLIAGLAGYNAYEARDAAAVATEPDPTS